MYKKQNGNLTFYNPKFILRFYLLMLFFVSSFCFYEISSAASLYFNPSSGDHNVGNIFTVDVLVNTEGSFINNSDGIIYFPTDLLDVVSVVKSNSIFNLWVEDPVFSNNAGTISFNGGLPTPGYVGSTGKVISIVFRAQKEGNASLLFSTAAVRANDGLGTDILRSKGQANFNLVSRTRIVEPITPVAIGTPKAPSVSSLTHPDSNKWYSLSDAEFTWSVGEDVTAVKLLVGKSPNSIPSVLYTSPISKKTIKDLGDGVWYFHVQLKNKFGWGETSHFKVQIDTQPPGSFEIKFIEGIETDNPRPVVFFTADDDTSGIDYYKVKTNGDEYIKAEADISSENPFILPLQKPGKHTILVKAYDKTGNYSTASEEFTIIPIDPPTIIDYPSELGPGEALVIRGESYPNSTVSVYFEDENEKVTSQDIKTNQDGTFTVVWEKRMRKGIHKFYTTVTDGRGAQSDPTDNYIVLVSTSIVFTIGSMVISYLTMLITLIGLILLLIFMILYTRYRILLLKKKIEEETKDVDTGMHKIFKILKEDVNLHLKEMKAAKTKTEKAAISKKALSSMKKNFLDAEKFLEKEINDIRDNLK